MITCSKCGDTYNENVNSKCPNCGTENWSKSNSQNVTFGRRMGVASSKAPVLKTISIIIAVLSVLGAVALFFIPEIEVGIVTVLSILIGGLFTAFILSCYAEHLEFLEHITGQLEEIRETIKEK